MKYILLLFAIFFCADLFGQKKWTGSGPGGWENALNWQPAGVPSNVDDVVLDNAYQENDYTITIPDIVAGVRSLNIKPSGGKKIELLLPATNKNSPAFIVGESIIISEGGIFRNSSGLTSGQSIQVNGSVYIFTEGRYIHNSRSAHANDLVAKLSSITGTSKGIFEFDVPGGAYPISLSNRTFGTLVLSSAASGGTQTYNASGTNPVTINGDLRISNGVQFNVDLTKDLVIGGDYIQDGGIFNIASQNNNNTVKIRGNISQASSGIITETAGGLPIIELSGNDPQQVFAAGSISNSVTVSINNPGGISLINPWAISYKLILENGTLKTSGTNILTILDSCSVSGGSPKSYIDGPMRKVGNSDFDFPIGKQKDYAPVKITRTSPTGTDEFIVEYFLANPQAVYGSDFENPPMVRVSALEYWSLKRLAGSSSCKLTLSVRTYSQATALDKLVVARWDAASLNWKSEGNEMYAGIATGTLTSKVVDGSGIFTLGSTVAIQNPLPEKGVIFKAIRNGRSLELKWSIEKNTEFNHFEIERSYDGKDYAMIGKLYQKDGVVNYQWAFEDLRVNFLKLKTVDKKNDFIYSDIVLLPAYSRGLIDIFPSFVTNGATITIVSNQDQAVDLMVSDIYGKKVKSTKQALTIGKNRVFLWLGHLRPGMYVLQMFDGRRMGESLRFLKL